MALALGCSRRAVAQPVPDTVQDLLARLETTPAVAITPDEVSQAFSLGTPHTDLQRDLLRHRLVGQVVEWDLRVFEVNFAQGIYQISSLAIGTHADAALNRVLATVWIYPRDDVDPEFLAKLRTGDKVRVRGYVRGVMLRTMVLIGPARLVRT